MDKQKVVTKKQLNREDPSIVKDIEKAVKTPTSEFEKKAPWENN